MWLGLRFSNGNTEQCNLVELISKSTQNLVVLVFFSKTSHLKHRGNPEHEGSLEWSNAEVAFVCLYSWDERRDHLADS